MFNVLTLLVFCTVLAYVYENGVIKDPVLEGENRIRQTQTTGSAKFAFLILAIVMVLFVGLRSESNDTLLYAKNFINNVPDSIEDIHGWSIKSNPLFLVYQVIIKNYISQNPQVFFLLTAVFVVTSYLLFVKKYSVNFGFTIYLLLSFTVYVFIMSAMKQTIAISIAIWSIPFIIKKQYIRASSLILIATFFHAYSFLFVVAFFLKKSVWDKRAFIIIAITVLVGFFFSQFVSGALSLTEFISDNEYAKEDFSVGTSYLRVLFYLIPAVITFVCRKKIRDRDDTFLNISVNLSLVATCFMLISGVGGANLVGRLANYFDIFICLSIPATIKHGIEDEKNRKIVTVVLFVAFALFYWAYYEKYRIAFPGFFTDYYGHVSLFDVLSNW